MKKFFRMITNKWLLKGTTTLILVALIIAGNIGINWLAEEIRVEDIDFTEDKKYSLSDETRKRLDALNADITIQLINMKGNEGIIEFADKYKKASKKVTIEEIDDLTSRVDLQTKYNLATTDSLIVVKNGDREATLTLYDLYTYTSSYNAVDTTEEAISNAIIEVTIEDKPKIYVLSGKTYYDPYDSLGIVATKLMQEANEIELVDIVTKGSIPEDCDCLIIPTLKQDLSVLERDKTLEYINNGGKILMLTSQGIINLDTPNLDQVLSQYGVTLGYGAVLEQDSSKMFYDTPNMILADASASFMDELEADLKLFMVSPGKIEFADETKLTELGVTYEVLASTSEKSFVRTKFDISSKSRTDEDSAEGFCIVGALASKDVAEDKKSELIIFSDETFVTPTEIANIGFIGKLYSNEDVVLNSISYLTQREDTITIRNDYDTETFTVTDREDVIVQTIIFTVPFIIIIIGIGVWIYRRRKV